MQHVVAVVGVSVVKPKLLNFFIKSMKGVATKNKIKIEVVSRLRHSIVPLALEEMFDCLTIDHHEAIFELSTLEESIELVANGKYQMR